MASQTLQNERKKSNNKMLPQWKLNLGPQPLGSDTLLSEPLRHVLLGRSKICIGHTLLVLTKWSKSKIEVVQEQKTFKDIPSNTTFNANIAMPIICVCEKFDLHYKL